MGRAFEYRKARKLKRWGSMAKTFTKIGKDITIAVKAGGVDPNANPRLRMLLQMGKAASMPKETVERAIKRAISKDQADYKEVVYEGYGPFGIAVMVETATDNSTRTVANIRNYFNKFGGSLGTSGSVEFMFERKCIFKIREKENLNLEQFELELIDYGVEEVFVEDGEIVIYADFNAYGTLQKYLEDNGCELLGCEFERIPLNTKELDGAQYEEFEKLLAKFEEDEDVQNVFHNVKT
ncbi:MAG: YebC/PmpR family DNA-binding transcriptional regulator [Bacteroidales bacterium]|jgi:YebC/PmpR family DNA-binding regulatory protein|nr:YebC/PmpR family DNA-binding transcriptional regulator [Bacteroidales bacterium]